jgi:hypothetical protein
VELTSTNEPFGLAKVSKPSLGWVGSEVPSDMHACLQNLTLNERKKKVSTPERAAHEKEKTDFVQRRAALAGSSPSGPATGKRRFAGGR